VNNLRPEMLNIKQIENQVDPSGVNSNKLLEQLSQRLTTGEENSNLMGTVGSSSLENFGQQGKLLEQLSQKLKMAQESNKVMDLAGTSLEHLPQEKPLQQRLTTSHENDNLIGTTGSILEHPQQLGTTSPLLNINQNSNNLQSILSGLNVNNIKSNEEQQVKEPCKAVGVGGSTLNTLNDETDTIVTTPSPCLDSGTQQDLASKISSLLQNKYTDSKDNNINPTTPTPINQLSANNLLGSLNPLAPDNTATPLNSLGNTAAPLNPLASDSAGPLAETLSKCAQQMNTNTIVGRPNPVHPVSPLLDPDNPCRLIDRVPGLGLDPMQLMELRARAADNPNQRMYSVFVFLR